MLVDDLVLHFDAYPSQDISTATMGQQSTQISKSVCFCGRTTKAPFTTPHQYLHLEHHQYLTCIWRAQQLAQQLALLVDCIPSASYSRYTAASSQWPSGMIMDDPSSTTQIDLRASRGSRPPVHLRPRPLRRVGGATGSTAGGGAGSALALANSAFTRRLRSGIGTWVTHQ